MQELACICEGRLTPSRHYVRPSRLNPKARHRPSDGWGSVGLEPLARELERSAVLCDCPDDVLIVVRDRIGFQYERQVGLDDFVSVREAAQLLDLPIMTVSRWVKGKVLKSSKKRGFAVIPVREVLRMAKERKRKLRLGSRLVVIG